MNAFISVSVLFYKKVDKKLVEIRAMYEDDTLLGDNKISKIVNKKSLRFKAKSEYGATLNLQTCRQKENKICVAHQRIVFKSTKNFSRIKILHHSNN